MTHETGPAAIVSEDVAVGRLPILYAARDEPVEPADSGWQFTSGRPDATAGGAKVWALKSVIEREPSLAEFLHLPPGAILERRGAGLAWQVSRRPDRGPKMGLARRLRALLRRL